MRIRMRMRMRVMRMMRMMKRMVMMLMMVLKKRKTLSATPDALLRLYCVRDERTREPW